ncbi:MAG TPA: UDP-N-acetylmuramoyl-tripeptide--D-alanyl-D-alanine ligase [Acidimicrobiales bacterium]
MSEVARATGGRLSGPDIVVRGVTIDSRRVTGGELFVPIVAARDGHDFVAHALAAGAAGYLTARPAVGGSAVEVDDTMAALTALGVEARDRLAGGAGDPPARPAGGPAAGRVVGITGSLGKTSVKDLLRPALAVRWRTWASLGSFNNELGVPLTLTNAPADTEAVIVEMGARTVGDIARLCAVARPTIGVVTRVAAVHSETFGDIGRVERAKGELVEALPADGTAVLNAADPRVAAMASRTSARVVTFGEGGDVRAECITLDDELRPSFRIAGDWGEVNVRLEARGAHMVGNALAAATAALVCGMPIDALPDAFAAAALSPWRMEVVRLPSGAHLINDAYNANPTSMDAALRSLAALPARRRIAVLGYMAELGPGSDEEHRAVARLARDLGLEVLSVGVPAYGTDTVASIEEVPAALGDLGPRDAVLVKASRLAGLERLAALLDGSRVDGPPVDGS